jgi:hypothetical protein
MTKRETDFEKLTQLFENAGQQMDHNEALSIIKDPSILQKKAGDEARFETLLKLMLHLSACETCRLEARKIVKQER